MWNSEWIVIADSALKDSFSDEWMRLPSTYKCLRIFVIQSIFWSVLKILNNHHVCMFVPDHILERHVLCLWKDVLRIRFFNPTERDFESLHFRILTFKDIWSGRSIQTASLPWKRCLPTLRDDLALLWPGLRFILVTHQCNPIYYNASTSQPLPVMNSDQVSWSTCNLFQIFHTCANHLHGL
jgi:hypothetical protein